ncbi:ketoacyl-ACP synthase III family protein [Streptomyces sp. ISL-22]|uniref:ketoacyl-ACP synthase III family protein n=1 Tax=unclassified Streptomyces TaxID=2593676 RepID=UPI001BE91517|nr:MULTISPECIES: ketoacyl-ACP synthase III family protein [unclassified Streptomyces]MBT2423721.1 ketoacyl-ACP synthase III family protein [Streptomyces sp. ISL-24]MBT2433845.1 ketoacyl-ACP synthase III family protein [Streptomyces sp. ISL-22]
MRHDNLYIAGVGAWYPKPLPVDEAIEAGWYDDDTQRRTGQLSVSVAGDDDNPPEMAARAGSLAVRHSGLDPAEFGLLLHATGGFCGLDGWNVGSYLQHHVLAGNGLSFEVKQQSNGAMAAIELAAAFLAAGTDRQAALITAADRFVMPVWNRWRTHPGLVFGDGASAAVLSRTGGFARVVSVVTESRPELEGAQRAGLSFMGYADTSDAEAYPIDLIKRMQAFADERHGGRITEIFKVMNQALIRSVEGAAEEAGIRPADADHLVFPNFGRTMLRQEVLTPLRLGPEKTVFDWARETGHVGATDQFGGLEYLVREGRLEPGRRVLLTGIGLGFNWTTAVLEITERPVPVAD